MLFGRILSDTVVEIVRVVVCQPLASRYHHRKVDPDLTEQSLRVRRATAGIRAYHTQIDSHKQKQYHK